MNNNAIVNTRLEELLGVMDPRANVTVFEKAEDGKEVIIASSKLYDILSGWFVNIYGSYKVIGLTVALGVASILIEEV